MEGIIVVLIYIGIIAIGFYIIYRLIRTAIKDAISESSDVLQEIITNAIKQSKIEQGKNKEEE